MMNMRVCSLLMMALIACGLSAMDKGKKKGAVKKALVKEEGAKPKPAVVPENAPKPRKIVKPLAQVIATKDPQKIYDKVVSLRDENKDKEVRFYLKWTWDTSEIVGVAQDNSPADQERAQQIKAYLIDEIIRPVLEKKLSYDDAVRSIKTLAGCSTQPVDGKQYGIFGTSDAALYEIVMNAICAKYDKGFSPAPRAKERGEVEMSRAEQYRIFYKYIENYQVSRHEPPVVKPRSWSHFFLWRLIPFAGLVAG